MYLKLDCASTTLSLPSTGCCNRHIYPPSVTFYFFPVHTMPRRRRDSTNIQPQTNKSFWDYYTALRFISNPQDSRSSYSRNPKICGFKPAPSNRFRLRRRKRQSNFYNQQTAAPQQSNMQHCDTLSHFQRDKK